MSDNSKGRKSNPWYGIGLTSVILFVNTIVLAALFYKGQSNYVVGLDTLFYLNDWSSRVIVLVLVISLMMFFLSLILGLRRRKKSKFED